MKRGFTLLELLIVIGILTILVGAMVPLFSYSRQSAAIIRAQRDEDIIVKAAMRYYYDTEQWPPVKSTISSDSDESCLISNAEEHCPTESEGWNGPYLAEGSNDPWGNPYRIIDVNNYCPPGMFCVAMAKPKLLVVQSLGPDETDAGCSLGDDLCTTFFDEGGGGGGGGGGFIK